MNLFTIVQTFSAQNLRFISSAILLAGLPFSMVVAAPTSGGNPTNDKADAPARSTTAGATTATANAFWPFGAEAGEMSCPTSISIAIDPPAYCTNTQGVLGVNAIGGTFTNPTYQWSISNARAILSSTTSATPDIDYITSGTTIISVTVTDGGACGTFTASQTITISTTPEPTITIPTTEVCQGNIINNITGSPSGSTRQWTVNNFSVGNPFGTFSAPTNQTTNFTANHAGSAEIFYEVTTSTGCTGTSEAQPITIYAPVVATAAVQGSNQPNVCADANLTLAASATGGNGSYGYVWEYMGGTQVIPTFVNASILLDNVNAQNPVLTPVGTASDGDTYIFRVKATDGILCEDVSDNITITVRKITSAALSVTGASTICTGGTTTFKVDVTRGNSGGSPTYTLVYNDGTADITVNDYVSGNSITTNTQSADFALSIVSIKDTRVTVSNCNSPSNGSPSSVTVNNLTAGVVGADQTVCSGDDVAAFTVSTAATGDGTLSYQWQISTDGGSTWNDINGATGDTYDEGTLTADAQYRRITTSTLNSVACTATGNVITVTVNNLTAGVTAGDQTICSGDDVAAFTVSTAATGDGALSYQWQISTDGGSTWNDINGATGATYNEGTLTADAQYRRITTSTLNSVACTATGNVITVTVNNLTAGVTAGDQTICSGDDVAAFTVGTAATGDGALSYEWEISTDGGSTWNDIATGATYDEGTLTADAQYRRMTISTLNSVVCTATGNVIAVTVNNITPGVIAGDQTICTGQTASFTQTTAATPDGTISYVWESSADDGNTWNAAVPAGTAATYTTGALTATTKFRRKDISTQNMVDCAAYTNELTVTVLTTTGGTWYVDATTGDDANLGTDICPKKTIQAAVTAAAAGDMVIVAAGTYAENLTITKGLDIRGANYNVACDSRLSESVIAPTSGLPVSITADGVSLNGFEITAPGYQYAILCGNTSDLTISYNNIHHINSSATPALSPTHAIQYTVPNAPAAKSNVSVTDNCINDIGSVNLTGNSATAMGFLQSTTTGTLTNLTIARNTISNVTVSNATWPTGKIAYGIQLNAGSANFKTTTGKIVDATIEDNVISGLSGHIATGIALEGNTENAVVTGNAVSNLTSTKNGNRAAGGVDLNGLKFESNRFVSTCTVENNSFETTTFNSALGNGVGYGVANYVPTADGGTATVTCNWFGTTSASAIADNAGLTGKILNKENCSTTFQPFYLVSGTDAAPSIGFQPTAGTCTGSAVEITSAPDDIYCGEADGSITVTINGGTAPYTVNWTGGSDISNGGSYTITALAAGTYNITVTDANGSTDSDGDIVVQYLPVRNATADTRHATIQAAIDAATANDVIEVCAGTYAQNVTINKALDVRGPNWDVSPNGGSRVAEAVIVPATMDTTSGSIVTITVSNVKFRGFTLDGDNTSLPPSGVGLGGSFGLSDDAARGVFVNANGVTGIQIEKNIARKLSNGVSVQQTTNYFATTSGAQYSYDILINDNKVESATGTAIRLGNSMYAKVTNNTIQNAQNGIAFSSFRIKHQGIAADRVVENNTISARFAGIWVNLFSATPYALVNNTITVAEKAPNDANPPGVNPAARTTWYGIMYSTVSAAQNFTNQTNLPKVTTPEYWTATGNTINGAGLEAGAKSHGYWLYYVDNNRDDSNVDHFGQISGGSVSNVDYGIMMKNRDTDPATNFGTSALGVHADVSNVSFSLNTDGVGISLKDDATWTTANPAPLINKRTVKLTIGDNVTITGGATGLLLDHPVAGTSNYTAYSSVTDGDLNNTTFSSQSGNYIELVNHPDGLDATAVSFDGNTGATATLAENFDIEDKVSHKTDNGTRGFVRVKAAEVFVTPTSASVQRGVDAASANDIVNVEAGTYTRNDNVQSVVLINKPLTMKGANAGIGGASPSRGAETIINGSFSPSTTDQNIYVVSIQANDVILDGFDITHPNYSVNSPSDFSGILVGGGTQLTGVQVINNRVHDLGSSSWVMTTSDSKNAINVGPVDGFTFSDNKVYDNASTGGAYCYGITTWGNSDAQSANNITISGNTFSNITGTGGADDQARAVSLGYKTAAATVTGNNISMVGMGVTTSASAASASVTVSNNQMDVAAAGVWARSPYGLTVTNNFISGTTDGVRVRSGAGVSGPISVTDNHITGVTKAINSASTAEVFAECNWYGTASSNNISSLMSGTVDYSPWLVNGTDDDVLTSGFQPLPNVCTGTAPAISLASKQNISCFGGNNGAINITITDGTAPFSYNWTGPNGYTNISDEDLAGLTEGGTYNLTITDVNGSTATFTESITAPAAAVTAVVANVDILCNGDISGTITVSNPEGGYGTYETSIDGTTWFAVTTGMPYTFSGLAAGLYNVQIRDAAVTACVTDLDGAGDTEISQPDALTVDAVAASAVLSCNNGVTTTITATAAGGTGTYTYAWSPSGGTMATTDPVGVGSYTVVVTDENGCEVTSTIVTISNPTHPGDGIWYVNDNSLTGDVLTTAVGNDANIGTASCPFATINHAISQASPGDMIRVDAGTYTENITVNKRLDINGVGDATIIQNIGNTVFTYTAAGSGTDAVDRAYLRNVKVSGSTKGLLASQLVNHLTLDDVTFDGNSSYAIHINNTSGVMSDWAITNSTFNANSSALYVSTAANIDGVTITGSTFTNQTNTAIYAGQSSSTPGGFSNVTITGNTFTTNGPSNNQAAFYLEKLSDAVISENTMTNNGLNTNPRGIIVNLKYGTYSNVSITDNTILENRGGAQTNGYGINVQGRNDAPSYSSFPGSLADVTISGNEISGLYRGIEIDNDVNWNFTAIQNNKVSGAEFGILGIIYGTGNTANTGTTMNIHENSILADSLLVVNFNPNGGTIDAECNWYGTINGSTIAGKMSGTVDYSPWLVDGTDDDLLTIGFQPVSGACSATAVEVSLTMQTNITGCFGDATGAIDISVTGGVPPYTYDWSNDGAEATDNDDEDLTGLTAGTYTVTVTDGIGTTGTLSVTITQPDAVTPSGTPMHVSCLGGNNGSITLTVTGGTGAYTYDWNGTPTGDGTATITGLTAGTYTVTVTDENSCTGTTEVTVNEPATAVAASITTQTNVSCNGGSNGSATVTPGGGTPGYSYSWDNMQSDATATGLAAGTYTVTVTDNNGCQTTASVTITEPDALLATISAQTNVSCNGLSDGSATVDAMGGTMPYTYDWEGTPAGDGSVTITGLNAGSYTVTVTDNNGCQFTTTATITQPDGLTLGASQTNVSCNAGNDGTATVTPAGGTTPYTYAWSNAQTDATATDLVAGTYTVIVTDANGCNTNTSVTITEPAVLMITGQPADNTATVTCGTSTDVNNEFTAWNTGVTHTGGAAPVTVSVNYTVTADVNGSLVETYNGVDPTAPPADGGYTVVTWTVTDNCSNTATVSRTFTVNNCMRISGTLKYYRDDSGVEGVAVDMVGTGANDGTSDVDGIYTVYSTNTGNFDVIPASVRPCEPCTTGTVVSSTVLKDNYNISVEDVDAIKEHIAAGAEFSNIYQRAAANVVLGSSGSQTNNRLTSADATALSQAINGFLTQQQRLFRRSIPHDEDLIAGAPTPLPRSWGLVPVANAGGLAPAQYGDFTQKRTYTSLDGAFTGQDFVVLQVGDVVDHNLLRGEEADTRYAGSPLIWKLKDVELTEGKAFDAEFSIEQMQNLRGWQFGLQFDPEYLKVDTLTTTDALPLDPEVNFGLYQADMGEIRSLWADGITKSLNKGESVFTLRFTALQGGKNLSDVLKLEEGSATYALTDQRDQVAVMLSFDGQVRADQTPVLYQNTPNPFDKETSVRFELPEAADIQLTIHDVNGRLIKELNGYYSEGIHEVRFGRGEMGQYAGVLYYTLRSGDFVATRKMVVID